MNPMIFPIKALIFRLPIHVKRPPDSPNASRNQSHPKILADYMPTPLPRLDALHFKAHHAALVRD
jgi:hypothetical protein